MINNQEEIIDVTPEEFELLSSYNNSSPQDISSQKTEEIIDVTPEEFELLSGESQPPEVDNLIQRFTGMTSDEQKKVVGDIINLAVKAPTAAVSSVVDIFGTPFVNAGVGAYNAVAPEDYQLPYAQSAKQTAKQGVDYVAGKTGIDTTKPTTGYEGAELAFEVGIPGALSNKLQKLIQTVGTKDITALTGSIEKFITDLLKTVGSTNPQTLAGAVGAGEAIQAAKEEGSGTLGQLGAGTAGAIAAETLANPKAIGKALTKLTAKGIGLGKNNLNTEAIDAAQRLGMEGLPSAAVTDSIVNGYLNQLISKTPIFGNKLRQSAKETSDQFQKSWNEMLESIAPKIDHALDKEARLLYKQSNNLIGKNDLISPDIILNKIKETKELLKSPLYSRPSEELLKKINELEKNLSLPQTADASSSFIKQLEEKASDLMNADSNLSPEMKSQILEKIKQNALQKEIYAPEILRAKIEMNKIMKDKNLFDRTDTDTLNFLQGIQDSIKETLAKYGETNPKWYKVFKEADEKYSKFARRENIEDLVSGKIRDYNSGEVKYHSLINTLENPENRNILKNGLGENNLKKLEDFVKVAQSMSNINKNILNPSSSAIVGSVLLTIQGLAFGANPFPALATTAGAYKITKLLTDKKFINKVNQFAKEPTSTTAKKIDSIIKEHLGIGTQALSKQINNQ